MSREAQVTSRLTIRKGNVFYPGVSQGHTEDVNSGQGPYPGAIDISVDGTSIDLSALETLGLCEVKNISSGTTNYIRLGTWNESEQTFNPFMKIYPGSGYAIRLDDLLETEFAGTGTTPGDPLVLRAKAAEADAVLYLGAFED